MFPIFQDTKFFYPKRKIPVPMQESDYSLSNLCSNDYVTWCIRPACPSSCRMRPGCRLGRTDWRMRMRTATTSCLRSETSQRLSAALQTPATIAFVGRKQNCVKNKLLLTNYWEVSTYLEKGWITSILTTISVYGGGVRKILSDLTIDSIN